MLRPITVFTSVLLATAALVDIGPSHALTMQECSAKYKAAQAAGTAKGIKWNDFRKAECGADATATPAAATKPETKPEAKPTAAPAPTTKAAAKPAPTPAPAAAGPAVYPTAVAPQYSKESPGKARMQTCLDQYNANKANNGNGGLNWIQKGGGYYAECNKRLKG
jgi:type IV secretory pathway VirB10-like protein